MGGRGLLNRKSGGEVSGVWCVVCGLRGGGMQADGQCVFGEAGGRVVW